MTCPKCEEGRIVSVILKMTGEKVSLCDYCETLWLSGETIQEETGHPFDIYTQGDAIEYGVDEAEEKDQDHRPAKYPEIR